MKVSGPKSGGATRTSGSKSAGKGSKKSDAKVGSLAPLTSAMTADALEVSDHVSTLEAIKTIVNETPDIRVDEVERVAQKLKSGYKIDFEKLAEAFIKEVIMNELARKSGKSGKR